jgi:hypothetical protein
MHVLSMVSMVLIVKKLVAAGAIIDDYKRRSKSQSR